MCLGRVRIDISNGLELEFMDQLGLRITKISRQLVRVYRFTKVFKDGSKG